jgi:hypothetical protein
MFIRKTIRRCLPPLATCVLVVLGIPLCAPAQVLNAFQFGGAPGVMLDTDGSLRARQTDPDAELAAMRARVKAGQTASKNEKLAYILLPKLFAQVASLRAAGKEVPEELRYLGGLTQLRYVFVFPEDKDILIAGPAEPWRVLRSDGDATDYVVGTTTGRPILQLDDLVSAFRTAVEGNGKLFGCGIYPSPDSVKIADDIAQRMMRNTRAERMQAMAKELGPQEVRIFGTQNDTRFALMCVAADYELKRFAMGLDRSPVPGVGNGVDHSRSAANKYWFEADYEPLRQSAGGNSYEIRGQRLLVRAGGFDFDPRGATEKAVAFAGQFTKSFPALATAVPLFAELQNITDESLLANLIRHDDLAAKIGWDMAPILDGKSWLVAHVPVPRTAETLVSFTNGSIVAGGVMLTIGPVAGEQPRQPGTAALDTLRAQAAGARQLGSAIIGPAAAAP